MNETSIIIDGVTEWSGFFVDGNVCCCCDVQMCKKLWWYRTKYEQGYIQCVFLLVASSCGFLVWLLAKAKQNAQTLSAPLVLVVGQCAGERM